mmetsp:Transcript_27831/g.58264  ORF Transcript_27831/g.58264 Transcript_27831/m.58264 type:complete len:91 (+) Transcript_27831:109-381(+)
MYDDPTPGHYRCGTQDGIGTNSVVHRVDPMEGISSLVRLHGIACRGNYIEPGHFGGTSLLIDCHVLVVNGPRLGAMRLIIDWIDRWMNEC